MMTYKQRCEVLRRADLSPALLADWTADNLLRALFEADDGDVTWCTMLADWFLEAIALRLAATEAGFWHCAISPTIVRSDSTTYVFETEGYSQWVEAIAIDE